MRIVTLVVVGNLALAGCSTTSAVSTNETDAIQTNSASLANLGVDNHGNFIGAAWPSIPASDSASIDGDKSRRYLELAQENFYGDNFGNSELYFRKAVEIRPDSVAAWAGLAASYDQLGRFDLSDRAYDQLKKIISPDMAARVDNNLGYSYLLRGNYKKAESYFHKAQNLDPSLAEVDGNLQLLEDVRRS
ncbi:MAG: tetratricopeptide repeat protein [Rhizobiaceae bacterium]